MCQSNGTPAAPPASWWATSSPAGLVNCTRASTRRSASRPIPTFELNLTALFATLTGKPVQAKPISTFPPVKQDLAFTVDETVTAGQLENVIRKAAGANLESIELFDVFTGEQVGEGKKSLAYAVVFRSPSKTLSAEDSDAIRKAIVAEAAEIGAQLRA